MYIIITNDWVTLFIVYLHTAYCLLPTLGFWVLQVMWWVLLNMKSLFLYAAGLAAVLCIVDILKSILWVFLHKITKTSIFFPALQNFCKSCPVSRLTLVWQASDKILLEFPPVLGSVWQNKLTFKYIFLSYRQFKIFITSEFRITIAFNAQILNLSFGLEWTIFFSFIWKY